MIGDFDYRAAKELDQVGRRTELIEFMRRRSWGPADLAAAWESGWTEMEIRQMVAGVLPIKDRFLWSLFLTSMSHAAPGYERESCPRCYPEGSLEDEEEGADEDDELEVPTADPNCPACHGEGEIRKGSAPAPPS